MLNIILYISGLIISLIIVVKSADVFVDNLVEIGSALGISEIILGVTAAAIGTSLPEFGSALIASLSGSVDIGVGTVIGSNIWNIAGILGISATVSGAIKTNKTGLTRDWLMTLITGLVLIFFMFFGDVNWTASVVMLVAYAFYFCLLVKSQRRQNHVNSQESGIVKSKYNQNRKNINKKAIILVALGLLGLIVSCRLLVFCGVELARIAGIPEMIMGLFTLAIGTSIPELVVTVSSAMKGLHALSIGTVLGSNTFNILIGIGIPALVMYVPVEPLSLAFDAPVMLFTTVLLMVLVRAGNMKLNRLAGIILLMTYTSYAIIRLFILT